MKVIVNFGEKKVLVPCGTTGDLLIRELIQMAINKYCKLSSNQHPSSTMNSDQVQLRLNNGAVVDPDDRVVDVVDDREELFAILDCPSNTQAELTSSMTSSNFSSSLSEIDRPSVRSSSTNRHEVIVTDADLRSRSLRVKTDSSNNIHISSTNNDLPTRPISSLNNRTGMQNAHIDDQTGDQIFSIYLPKESSPLGIHVIPYNTQSDDHVQGLVLQTIEPEGRIQRQGILQVNDRIIEINRINIEQCSFDKAQQIFRNALVESELELRIVRSAKRGSFFLNHSNAVTDFPSNSKKFGKIIKISLQKGTDGLGFKLAARDNPTGTANPIYVKTIFGKGAAVEDGRLRTGDRLLMVNSIDVTQLSLQDAVSLLRETRVGETIDLCVSRQQDGLLPKDLINDEKSHQIMTLDIPLRDTSSAGLGITLKGKTSIIDGESIDLGIFIKSILTGGAAYRDNRLRPNDQILVINDFSLVNLSNIDAANILHDAVRKEIHPGYIKITVSRALNHDSEIVSNGHPTKNVHETDLSSPGVSQMNDENELDLTNFVAPINRRISPQEKNSNFESEFRPPNPPTPLNRDRTMQNEKQSQDENTDGNSNPFDRETPFRQSISEKRRLNQQANKQAVQWKQQSFHEDRTSSSEKRNPLRGVLDSNNNIPMPFNRSSSFESLPRPTENRSNPQAEDEKKRQAKLRNRAWNESFRQAVDKSYGHTNSQPTVSESVVSEKSSKLEKNRFKFSNLFLSKSKRKENQEEKSIKYSSVIDDHPSTVYPPPPAPFSSRQDALPSKIPNGKHDRYQPHRFESTTPQLNEHQIESKVTSGKSSVSIHPVLPRAMFTHNINGSQSLKYQTRTNRATLTIPTNSFNGSIDLTTVNQTQQRKFYPNSQSYVPFESPANV